MADLIHHLGGHPASLSLWRPEGTGEGDIGTPLKGCVPDVPPSPKGTPGDKSPRVPQCPPRAPFEQKVADLVRHGLRVFPLTPMLKIPAISAKRGGRGCLDATTDAKTIADWSVRYYRANVGIATGQASGVIVIDIDPKNGADASLSMLREQGHAFPKTVCCRTPSGGRHLYFQWVPGISNSANAIAAGIDVRSDRGYVVAPPSVTQAGQYEWLVPLDEMRPAVLPDWIGERLKKPEQKVEPRSKPEFTKAEPRIDHLFDLVASQPEGNRNDYLFWAACRIAEQGLMGKARGELIAAARHAGLPEAEILQTIASAERIATCASR